MVVINGKSLLFQTVQVSTSDTSQKLAKLDESLNSIIKTNDITFVKVSDHTSKDQHAYFAHILSTLNNKSDMVFYFEIHEWDQSKVDKFLSNPSVKFEDVFSDQNSWIINYKPILEVCRMYSMDVVCSDGYTYSTDIQTQDKYIQDKLEGKVTEFAFNFILNDKSYGDQNHSWDSIKSELKLRGSIDDQGQVVNTCFDVPSSSKLYPYKTQIEGELKKIMSFKSKKKIVFVGANHFKDLATIGSNKIATIVMEESKIFPKQPCIEIDSIHMPLPYLIFDQQVDSTKYYQLCLPENPCE